MSHTKGPWIVDGDNGEYISPIDGGDIIAIAHILPIDDNWDDWSRGEQTKANALLISAAPDLLEALEQLLEYGSMTGPDWPIDQAREAIDKARGNQ